MGISEGHGQRGSKRVRKKCDGNQDKGVAGLTDKLLAIALFGIIS